MLQIKDIEDLVGKTIVKSVFNYDEFCLKFEDGSFAVFVVIETLKVFKKMFLKYN